MKNKSAFSLIELSIVLLIIGIIVAGIIGGSKLIQLSNLTKARALTNSSPVAGIENLTLWLDATSKNSFTVATPNDQDLISTWYDINPQVTTRKIFVPQSSALAYDDKGINGLPAIFFAGAGGFTRSTYGYEVSSSNEVTVFVVLTPITKPGSSLIYIPVQWGINNDVFNIMAPFINGSNINILWDFGICCGANGRMSTSAPSNFMGKPSIISTIVKTDASVDITVNNSVISSSNNFNSPLAINNLNNMKIGVQDFNGYIGEVIIYNRGLSTPERLEITRYLSKKWGIKLN